MTAASKEMVLRWTAHSLTSASGLNASCHWADFSQAGTAGSEDGAALDRALANSGSGLNASCHWADFSRAETAGLKDGAALDRALAELGQRADCQLPLG